MDEKIEQNVVEEVVEQQNRDCKIDKNSKDCRLQRTRRIAHTGIFAAISVILYIAHFPPFVFPIFPGNFGFLEINFSEVPALIGAYAYGPFSGFIILFIRMLIKLPMSGTMMVGEFADLVYSSAFILPASIIYKRRRDFKHVFIGLGVSFAVQLIVSTGANYFIVHELYNQMFFQGNIPFTREEFIAVVFPFNLIKNTLIATLTILLYKRLMSFLNMAIS